MKRIGLLAVLGVLAPSCGPGDDVAVAVQVIVPAQIPAIDTGVLYLSLWSYDPRSRTLERPWSTSTWLSSPMCLGSSKSFICVWRRTSLEGGGTTLRSRAAGSQRWAG